ncbi:hypothetical protein MBLNU13_g02421t1 [Cladosporium sp. NU13]
MDRRQFMPRYTPDKAVQPNSGIIESTKISRAPRAPPRTAPPILPPRNPKRLGLAPRSPEKLAESWDPKLGAYKPRQSSGGFAPINKKDKTTSKPTTSGQFPRRSISTSAFQQHTPLPASATERRERTGHSLHEEIKNLRQSYIDLQSDDIFAPAAPPQRSVSAASLRSPVRNFSLPTNYSPPPKQQAARPWPLHRVRSRSVNLGPVVEASELPDLPVRRESPKATAVNIRVGDESELDHALTTPLPESAANSIGTKAEPEEINLPAAVPEPELAMAFQIPDSTTTTPTIVSEADSEQVLKQKAIVESKRGEGTCKCCGSTRKVLAMNPTCCIDRAEEKGRVCFRCWSDRLAEGVSKYDRKDWLCCLICGKELVVSDAKRLASRGTILRYRVKIATSRIRASFPTGANERVEGAAMWVM